ncbi:MAG: hypothetical protein ACI8RD_011079 [Bacillariaceae sp.]|jgi:hypothetical protein
MAHAYKGHVFRIATAVGIYEVRISVVCIVAIALTITMRYLSVKALQNHAN